MQTRLTKSRRATVNLIHLVYCYYSFQKPPWIKQLFISEFCSEFCSIGEKEGVGLQFHGFFPTGLTASIGTFTLPNSGDIKIDNDTEKLFFYNLLIRKSFVQNTVEESFRILVVYPSESPSLLIFFIHFFFFFDVEQRRLKTNYLVPIQNSISIMTTFDFIGEISSLDIIQVWKIYLYLIEQDHK